MEKKKTSLMNMLPIIVSMLLILFIVVFAAFGEKQNTAVVTDKTTESYAADFTWIDEKGNEVDMPYSPDTKAGVKTSISTTLPDDLEDNMVIFIRTDQLRVSAYIDDELRLSYCTDNAQQQIGTIPPRRYISLKVNAEDAGKIMRLELACAADNLGKVNIEKYGSQHDIEMEWVEDSIGDVLVAIAMIVICFLTLILGLVFSISYRRFFGVIYLSIMGLLASVWILCNSEINQMFITSSSVCAFLDYSMLLLLPFPFLFFMNRVQNRRFNILYIVFEVIVVANVISCLCLEVFKVIDIAQLFPVIAGVFGCSLIMILITMGIDIFKNKNKDYIIVAIGILAGIVATLVQFALFIMGVISFGGKTVGYALLIILLTTIIDTFKSIKKTEEMNQMAVAEGKAESRFLANMSHEIRTPINAVLGMNEMILRETKEDFTKEYAESIETSGRMLLSIVNDILDFSKIRTGKMKIVPVKYSLLNLTEEVKNMIASRAMAKSLIFTADIDKNLPDGLFGDDVRIKQIIINLLSNAVKYTEKGSVTFKVEDAGRKDDQINLKITVSDTGKGIKEEDKDSLFEAFTRVDEKSNRNIVGTGLGLALVDQLVKIMNGTIEVQSVYGKGSSFIVVIPQKIEGSDTIAAVMGKGKDAASKENTFKKTAMFKAPEAKILVVDDTPLNLTVVKKLLKRTEINVTCASNGIKCLEILRNESFDVVLLDHLMPEMDGEETLKKIKEENLAEGTPIIILTANAIEGSREMFLKMGFDDYVSKPVNPDVLEGTLMRYLPEEKIIKS